MVLVRARKHSSLVMIRKQSYGPRAPREEEVVRRGGNTLICTGEKVKGHLIAGEPAKLTELPATGVWIAEV